MSFSNLWTVATIVDSILVVGAVVLVLYRPREPRAMLAWIFALIFLPVIGLIAFAIAGEPRYMRTRRRRARRRQRLQQCLARQAQLLEERRGRHRPHQVSPGAAILQILATRLSRCSPTVGNKVTIYHGNAGKFNALCKAIREAKHHIHLEYYIYQPDDAGKLLRDLLLQKAAEGVKVRLLLDAIGCWNWSRAFRKTFEDGKVNVAFHMPVLPWRGRWRVNFRNHRKIAVIDGEIGFTGSENIGDEYRGRRKKFAWRDTHLRIQGPAVQQLQDIFVEDWHDATREDLTDESYFPAIEPIGSEIAQVIPSGPDTNTHAMHHLLLAAVGGARRSVSVITPYFAPDTTMLLAFQSAAYRGVRVQLLIPSKTDQFLVLWAGRSFYPEMMEAGVEIREYDRAMLHSKVMVVDDSWALVGSANMDQRSFRINFEVTTILYEEALAHDLQDDFDARWAEGRPIDHKGRNRPGFGETILLGLARLASPIL
jgi:cardiolipin synthase